MTPHSVTTCAESGCGRSLAHTPPSPPSVHTSQSHRPPLPNPACPGWQSHGLPTARGFHVVGKKPHPLDHHSALVQAGYVRAGEQPGGPLPTALQRPLPAFVATGQENSRSPQAGELPVFSAFTMLSKAWPYSAINGYRRPHGLRIATDQDWGCRGTLTTCHTSSGSPRPHGTPRLGFYVH